ncbi:hypothetical protein GCM10007877_01750 [Marinibactrum halimedae]|uniref:Peptidase C58 YopT-type domain-containing protein n=1 Tax=Marinibactrum halimedae TaxID=1444977 RepID=A0AA37T033_9GAMM|nr:hypothetical protein GCM10007877_01750 [Marinibactrum halimedae]
MVWRLRTVLRQKSAHAVAAFISCEGDVEYFDPNFGQFRFSNIDDFDRFFSEYFGKSYMNMTTTFNKSWSVRILKRLI